MGTGAPSRGLRARGCAPQVSILSSFESRLMKLENSIIPVHTQTENLQRLQENVEKTLACLDHVIGYYHVASDTEKTIREGWAGALGRDAGICGHFPALSFS